jgi:Tol biopolymer transport system component
MKGNWISAAALGVLPAAVVCASSAAGPRQAAPSQIVSAANRSPRVNGEIYRVNSDGRRVDLSNRSVLDAGWRTLSRHLTNILGAPSWGHDGSVLAYTTNEETVQVVGPSGKHLWTVDGSGPPGAEVQGLAWSPDGRQFALSATDANGIGEISTVGVDGKGPRQLTRNLGAVVNLSWRC